MKVQNMTNDNGRAIPNQFILYDEGKICFQSYNSVIVEISNGQVYIDPEYYKYSNTTIKYRNRFLQRTSKEVERLIKEGVYKFKNLN